MAGPDAVKLNYEALIRELEGLRRAAAGGSIRRFTEYARAGQQVEGLLHEVAWLRLELDGKTGEVMLTWQGAAGDFRTARGDGLPDALQGAEPAADGKVCNGPCGSWRPLTAYSRDANRSDGRCQRCRRCESLRLRDHKRRKRGAG